MESIGFDYNNKNYLCQPLGTGKWQCGESPTPAQIQLTCENNGIDKITCSLPESTTNLVCETSYAPFNCELNNNTANKARLDKDYLENSDMGETNPGRSNISRTIIPLVFMFIIFFLLIFIGKAPFFTYIIAGLGIYFILIFLLTDWAWNMDFW